MVLKVNRYRGGRGVNFFYIVCIFFCMTASSLAAEQAGLIYDSAVLTEDVTWRGTVLVRGYVIVAPQATLRIEPGTTVRFVGTAASQLPNMVVLGRVIAAGTVERPILLSSERSKQTEGSWGGIVFLTTEKRNLLEQCRIENADIGIDLRFSTISLKAVTITHARTALLSHDGIILISGSTVADSGTGIEVYDSEFEGRDMTVASCQRGFVVSRSAVMLVSTKIINNKLIGLEAEECRIKITGGDFIDNALGARISGGEGQITMASFLRNNQTALHLQGARVKIQRCLFAENRHDAIRCEDGRSLLVNNAFSSNGGYNLYNSGSERISARQNWWGTADQTLIVHKIFDPARDKKSGVVVFFPWLPEKPQLML